MSSFACLIKKELIQFYLTPLGWIFHSVFLLLHGLLFSFAHTFTGMPETAEFWGSAAILQVLLIPVLTMKSFTDEYRLGTYQLYYITPVSRTMVVLAKYVAALLVYFLSMALFLLYPLALGRYGRIDAPELLVSTLGALLAGAVYIAAGLCISAASKTNALAAVMTTLVLLVNWLTAFLVPFIPVRPQFSLAVLVIAAMALVLLVRSSTRGALAWGVSAVSAGMLIGLTYLLRPLWYYALIQNLLMHLSVVIHQQSFVLGIIPLASLVLFLVFITCLLQVTVMVLDRRRWKG